jgi:hypothetical protein
MPYKILFVLLAFLYAGSQLNSQQILEQLATNLSNEYSKTAKELLVLQTDKSIYQAGTEVWFRAYAISSNGFPAEAKDKVIYVELANDKDSVIDRVLLNKEALQYNGSIPVPLNLKEGFYQLRAYTKTILQQSPSEIFVSPVYITNNAKAEIKNQLTNSDAVYKFYTEGDELINGVKCTVVYTAMDKNGLLPASGAVKDNFGNEVAKFSGNGIGKIEFEPYSKDRTYKVFIKTNNSAEQSFSLPEIKTGTFQLSLQKQTKDELVFRVALGDSAYNKKADSYLLGVAGGKICFASSGSGMYMVNIPVSSLPHGIVDFYLFDGNKKLKSKRSIFNENYNSVVNITADKQEYTSRQKAKLNINVTDYEGKPIKAVFSVSVRDKILAGESSVLHDADLYCLTKNGNSSLVNAFANNSEIRDLLLITLNSQDRFSNEPEIRVPEDFYWDGLEIRGRIEDKQSGPFANQIVMLMPEQENATLNDSTDNKGVFLFHNMTFYGKKRFHVMIPAVYNKQQKYNINEEMVSFPIIHTSSNNLRNLSLSSLPLFKQHYADSSIAGNTRIYLQQLALQEDSSGNKKNKGSKTNDLLNPHRITAAQLDKLSLSNTSDAVKMLPGVMMMGGRLTIRGGLPSLSGNLGDIEPLLIVDGVDTKASSVIDYLNSIPPSNIDYIEVYTGPEASMYGSRGGNGAIVVKTSNQTRDKNDDKQKQTIIASGFYKEQNFYQPPYDRYIVREASFVDNRATIYWNGQVITDDAGKASVSFYTADLKNDYTVIVQGITEKGELVYKTYTIKKR